jgi:RNA polymerase sigma factor (sigma-70 family)
MEGNTEAVLLTDWAVLAREGDAEKREAIALYLRDLLVRRFRATGLDADQCQELAQECLFDVISNLARYDETKASLTAWVSGFARTSLRSWRRREYGRNMMETPLDFAPEICAEDDDMNSVDCAVKTCLGSLSLIDQELLYMRFNLGLSFDEIADRSDLTAVNARKRLSRAVDRLRRDPMLRESLGFETAS